MQWPRLNDGTAKAVSSMPAAVARNFPPCWGASDPGWPQNRGSNSLRYADEVLKLKSLSTRPMRLWIVDRF
jgi:hypothetical protein